MIAISCEINNSEQILEDQLNYIEKQKSKGEANGDNLCIEAGYVSYTDEGSAICRLDLFSTELIKAKKAKHIGPGNTNAKKEILNSYDLETLKMIALHGCISGKAHSHLQITENEEFFDNNKDEITISLEDQFGTGYLETSAERSGGNSSHWKHRAVWRFIEMIANDEIDKIKSHK